MERLQLVIGKFMITVVCLSSIIVLSGGILYLFQYGADTVHYNVYHSEPKSLDSFFGSYQSARSVIAEGIIQFGIFILVAAQIGRVVLTTWLFMKLRDYWFVVFSLFILVVLGISFSADF